jgi:hypothetical protein
MSKSVPGIAGWIGAALALAVAAVVLAMYSQLEERTMEESAERESSIASLTSLLEDRESELAALKESLDAADRLNAVQQMKISDLEQPESPVESEAKPPEDEKSADQAEKTKQNIARAQMAMVADMMYGSFYDESALSSDVRSKVRNLTADSLAEAQQLGAAAFNSGEKTAAEVKEEHDEVEKQMIAGLRGILDEEQMAAWEIYHEESDRILYENLIDGHLRMLAPGLTDDYHDATTVVFAEKLGTSLEEFESSSEIYSMVNYNKAQSRGLNEALTELSELLPEDQYSHAERFVVQSEEVFKAMEGSGAE